MTIIKHSEKSSHFSWPIIYVLVIRLAVKTISKIQQPYGLIKVKSSYTSLGRLCERINTIDPNKHGVDQI